MTTSGTYAFNPSLGDLTLNAFSRIGIRPTALQQEHLFQARVEANLLQSDWANKGPNLWAVDLQTFTCVSGTAAYTLPTNTIGVLDVYCTVSGVDNQMMPISRSDYASYGNKATSGQPSVYWVNRQITPVMTLYPVPDSLATYKINYYRMRMIQDEALRGGTAPELPFRWLDAMAAGLAYRLARHFAQPLEAARKVDAMEAYDAAASEDTEDANLYITPGLAAYYR